MLGNIRSSEEQFDRLAGGLGVESECGLLRLEAVFRCQPTALCDMSFRTTALVWGSSLTTQLVKCSPSIREALGSVPNTT